MCSVCDQVREKLTPTTMELVSQFNGAILNHFIRRNEHGTGWDMDAISEALVRFIEHTDVAQAVDQELVARQLFVYGAMCAFDMLASEIVAAKMQIVTATDEELDIVTDVLRGL